MTDSETLWLYWREKLLVRHRASQSRRNSSFTQCLSEPTVLTRMPMATETFINSQSNRKRAWITLKQHQWLSNDATKRHVQRIRWISVKPHGRALLSVLMRSWCRYNQIEAKTNQINRKQRMTWRTRARAGSVQKKRESERPHEPKL